MLSAAVLSQPPLREFYAAAASGVLCSHVFAAAVWAYDFAACVCLSVKRGSCVVVRELSFVAVFVVHSSAFESEWPCAVCV